ncbi:MAG: class I adenylate-forming enzyme family protein [Pseudomonadota bacterium]
MMLLHDWLTKAVKVKGGAKALVYRDTYLSWRGLSHRVNRRADEFANIGVRPGDFVGVMLGNVPDFLILSLALSKLEAAPLPLDPTTSTRELEMIMSILPIRGMITRPRGGDAPLPSLPATDEEQDSRKPSLETRKRLQGTLLSCSIYDVPERDLPRRVTDRIAAVLVTCDSAGDPKPVERTYKNLAVEANNLIKALELTEDDRALLTLPLFHSFGFDLGLVAGLASQMTLYLEDEIAPARIVKLVRDQKITVLPSSSVTLFAEIAKLPSVRPFDHKSIRMLSLGSGLSGSVLDVFRKKYGVRPFSCYHNTETGTVSIDLAGQSGQTVGKPMEDAEVKITDGTAKKKLPSGRKGVLWVRSDAVSPLKLCPLPKAGKDVPVGGRDKNGWYRTGDLATIDRAGRITLKDREDDVVHVEGRRVVLGEVEGCIESFPEVSAAQADVITDAFGGPMIVVRVVIKGRLDMDPEIIIDHCARHLSPFKVPRRIEICEEL